ncbi:CPBP family intramembrane glutamic endopeptidase [Thermoactinomyces mirandus]|uniref:CPBP family intramembrane metalloprotease n=1 Tax=Thermoactinomyces mirandus TaxID=2756294 RepID=A0A7W1XTK4_9BACL|nr:CPBP family intramembrane glutamic endopeptidase [Thermoactinomyces mirandus]MBA4602941.1 CPBP family intramembrane metalloprotease [Thermoactinomyces mirandus]
MTEVIINVINNLILFTPIIALFLLINLSEKLETKTGKALGFLSCFFVILGFLAAFLIGITLYLNGKPFLPWARHFMADGGSAQKLAKIGLSLWLPALVAIIVFIPGVRRLCSRFLPIDPQNRVHTLALSMSMIVFIQFFVTQSFGLSTLNQQTVPNTQTGTLSSIWSQDILLAILGLVGVGWLTRRSFKQTLARLGLWGITWKQAGTGMLIGLVMLLAPIIAQQLSIFFDWADNTHANELTDKILGPLLTSIPGILTLGFAAALGEEIIFRGALLPRLGFIYTSILFTLVHANYGFSVNSLVVLLLAIVLGWARIRYNTIVCMIIHATYNIFVSLLGNPF